jgi:hypothetical protein
MGHREVRPVPLDWEHPTEGITRGGKPRYVPLHSRADLRWSIKFYEENPQYASEWQYRPEDYMPEIPEGTPLGYQLYETTSEGTPVSPVFKTLEELATYCGSPDNDVTVFADCRWTADQWLASFRNDSLGTDSLAYWTPSTGGLGVFDPLARSED